MYFDVSVMLPDSVNTIINAGESMDAKEFSMMLCVNKCPEKTITIPKEVISLDNAYRMCE